LEFLSWHEAQMWAFGGRNDVALPMFETTRKTGESSSDVAWNLYVDGTLAFRRLTRPALEAAIASWLRFRARRAGTGPWERMANRSRCRGRRISTCCK